MAYNYYAVKSGKKAGIYESWSECASQVTGFKGAIYKGFKTREEAEYFMGDTKKENNTPTSTKTEITPLTNTNSKIKPKVKNFFKNTGYAFTDGSYNDATKTYGFGGFLVDDEGNQCILQGSHNDKELAKMRNVAGEIWGSMAAAAKALELGMNNLTLYYDYLGIEMWVTGKWKANETGTQYYRDYMRNLISCGLTVEFVKVKGHSGIEGNELADKLAKEAVGLIPKLNKSNLGLLYLKNEK